MVNNHSRTFHGLTRSSHQQYIPYKAGAWQLAQKLFGPVTGWCRRDFCSILKNGERWIFSATSCNQHNSVFSVSPHSLLHTSACNQYGIQRDILLFEPAVDWVHSRHCFYLPVDCFGTMQAFRANYFPPSSSRRET